MLILSRQDVEAVLTMPDTIAAVEAGFRDLALGNVVMPQRVATPIASHNGLHLSMPAFVAGDPGILTIKVVTVFGNNVVQYHEPTIQGVLLLHDARTGRALSLMDAEYLTAMRTGAASGVATRWLARQDAHVVTLFGAGAQGGPQLAAMCAVRPIDRALVVTRTGEHDDTFARRMATQLNIAVEPTRDVRAAVEQADIICTATNSPDPLFDGNWLRPGTHINAVGAYTRTMRELDTTTMRRSRVYVDRIEAALTEAGDIVIPISEGAFTQDHLAGELGAVLTGKVPGRTDLSEITIFKSVGMAVQDAVTAPIVYARALEQGLGQQTEL